MAVLRRHWKLTLLHALLVCSTLSACMYLLVRQREVVAADIAAPAGGASPTAALPPLDPVLYSQLRELRATAALTTDDLAAVDCSEQQAEAALSALRAWALVNAVRIREANDNHRAAQRSLDDAMRLVNVGPRSEPLLGQLPSLNRSVLASAASRSQLVAEAASAASSTQAQSLRTAAANAGLPDALRYAPGPTAEQQELARVAAGKGRPVLGAVPAAKARHDAAQANRQRAMPGVLAAEERVLPVPPELVEAPPRTPAAGGAVKSMP